MTRNFFASSFASPGFFACKIKSFLFHENRIFGRLNHYDGNMPKSNGALPRIRTRRTESYTPFQERQQEQHRKCSESASGKDEKMSRIWL
jgi:hypothetical protein